jgi:N-acetyl-anhydromuramyl-L-alanine amidase AmpD
VREHIHLPRPRPNEISGQNEPDTIIIHAMAEKILDPEPLDAVEFMRKYGYSAHSVIYPDGKNVRCRQDNEFAYHAKGYNRNSLGIEVLVPGEHDYASFLEAIAKPDWVTEAAFQKLVYQTKEGLSLYPIKRVARHSDLSPGRKLDPGKGFPWGDFLHEIGMG